MLVKLNQPKIMKGLNTALLMLSIVWFATGELAAIPLVIVLAIATIISHL